MANQENGEKQKPRHIKLGECLVQAGLIDEKTLLKALDIQKVQKKKIGQILMDMGVADDEAVARALARQLRIPFVRLQQVQIPKEILSMVPAEMAENYSLIPLREFKKKLVVAVANPLEPYATDDLRFVTRMSIVLVVAPQKDILDALHRHYPKRDLEKDFASGPGIDEGLQIIQRTEKEDVKDIKEIMKLTELPPIVRFTNAILADAVKLKASDIHIEPQKAAVVIRYRIDGILREIMQIDRQVHSSVVSRVKVVSNMDISVRRKPQDGRSQIRYGDKYYDLRVSSLPTAYGEKVTIRLLDQSRAAIGLEELGFSDKALKDFENAILRPQGIILVTGPTGSGKSSTLYSCLQRMNAPTVNIITVEDPVEYEIPGINQVQINPLAGITFASGLRSILRQDPDIVMVGEIRDGETAAIAFQAAQTGHLVLSTLHTNDSLSAITRLIDLGVQPYLISSALTAVVGQRLVRRICPKCKDPVPIPPKLLERLPEKSGLEGHATVWEGKGCEACQYTGYSGRLAIFEVLMVTPSLRSLIAPGITAPLLKMAAEKEGFETMTLDGIKKAIMGITTIEEVFRVAPPPESEEKMPDADLAAPTPFGEARDEASPSEEVAPAALSSVSPKKILVADDSEIVLKILKNLLEAENYLVITAHDGLEALKLSTQEKPDLVITDLLMPEMDGITLTRKLKSQLTTRYIPIILHTAKGEVDSEVTAMDAGADDYLTKPVDPKRFLARVNRLLNRTWMAQF